VPSAMVKVIPKMTTKATFNASIEMGSRCCLLGISDSCQIILLDGWPWPCLDVVPMP
jgi:hypothetical protein